jgi:hypothetical protein
MVSRVTKSRCWHGTIEQEGHDGYLHEAIQTPVSFSIYVMLSSLSIVVLLVGGLQKGCVTKCVNMKHV